MSIKEYLNKIKQDIFDKQRNIKQKEKKIRWEIWKDFLKSMVPLLLLVVFLGGIGIYFSLEYETEFYQTSVSESLHLNVDEIENKILGYQEVLDTLNYSEIVNGNDRENKLLMKEIYEKFFYDEKLYPVFWKISSGKKIQVSGTKHQEIYLSEYSNVRLNEQLFYHEAKEYEQCFLSTGYYSDDKKHLLLSLVVPVRNENGEIISAYGLDLQVSEIVQVIEDIDEQIQESILLGKSGEILYHKNGNTGELLKDMSAIKDSSRALAKMDMSGKSFCKMKWNGRTYSVNYIRENDTGIQVLIAVTIPKAMELAKYRILTFLSLMFLTFAVYAMILLYTLTSSHQRISQLKKYIEELLEGNMRAIPEVEGEDEITDIVQSVSKIQDNFKNLLEEMKMLSMQITLGADQIAERAQDLAEGSIIQTDTIEQLAQTVQKLQKNMRTSVINNRRVRDRSIKVSNELEKTNEQLNDMITAMDRMKQEFSKIQNIVKSIDDISFQTGLLAINANVEAVRSENESNSFQIIAEQIRQLADECNSSAQAAGQLFEDVREIVDRSMNIAKVSEESMKNAVEEGHAIRETVSTMAEFAEVELKEFTNIMASVKQISKITNENSISAQDSAASSQELFSMTETMKDYLQEYDAMEE